MTIETYQLKLKTEGLSPNTVRTYVSFLRKIFNACDPLTEKSFSKFLVQVLDDTSPSNANKYIKALKKYAKYEKLEWVKNVTKIKETPKPRQLLTDDEIEALCDVEFDDIWVQDTAQTRYNHFVMTVYWKLLAFTGMRGGEVRTLTRVDFDFANRAVNLIKTKTREARKVPIPGIIFDDVLTLVNDCQNEYVFSLLGETKGLSEASARFDFNRRLDAIGVHRDVKPHSLRHSMITRLLTDVHAPLYVVQDIVGHKDSRTTQGYYHGNVKAMHKAIERDPLSARGIEPMRYLRMIVDNFLKLIDPERFNVSVSWTDNGVNISIRTKKESDAN